MSRLTKEKYLNKGDRAYITGAWVEYVGKGKWKLHELGYDDDMFFEGGFVNDRENKPSI